MELIAENFLKQLNDTLRKQAIIASVYDKLSYRIQKCIKKRQVSCNDSTLTIDIEFHPKMHCLLIFFNSRQELIFITNDEDLALLDDKFFISELFPMSNSVLRIESTTESEIAYRYSFNL